MTDNLKLLMSEFNFTEADLQANREGRLTENQLSILREQNQRKFIALIITLGVCVFVLITSYSKPVFGQNNGLLNLILTIFVGVLVYVLIADYRKHQAGVDSGAVDSTYGPPSFRTFSGGRNGKSYRVSIGEKQFGLTRAQYQTLEAYFQKESPGSRLTVYFTPEANVILSLEPRK